MLLASAGKSAQSLSASATSTRCAASGVAARANRAVDEAPMLFDRPQ